MSQQAESEFITLFTGEVWQAKMIQSVLEQNEIFATIKNELMSSIEPWAISSGGVTPAELLVSAKNYDEALKLLEEFNNSEPDLEGEI